LRQVSQNILLDVLEDGEIALETANVVEVGDFAFVTETGGSVISPF
jgi:hypothetical protein